MRSAHSSALVVGLVAALWAHHCALANSADQIYVSSTVVVLHEGSRTSITTGVNDLDRPSVMQCVSAAGCVLTSIAQVFVNPNQGTPTFKLCLIVDNVAAVAGCNYMTNEFVPTVIQDSFDLVQGNHTVHTELVSKSTTPLYNWHVNYTLYDR